MNFIPIHKAKRKCPVCNHKDWCMIADDGTIALCQRARNASGKTTKGGYYIHKLNEPLEVTPVVYSKAPAKSQLDWELIAANAAVRADEGELSRFAQALHVGVGSLRRLGIGRYGRSWAFPMYSGERRMIGIRLRGDDGKKLAITGSANGLFCPQGPPVDPLLVTEGPTDAAAILDAGYDVVGRASNNSCVEFLKVFVARRHVVIVADRDRAGYDRGAVPLGKELKRSAWSVRILVPPAKDAREWRPSRGELSLMIDSAQTVKG